MKDEKKEKKAKTIAELQLKRIEKILRISDLKKEIVELAKLINEKIKRGEK